MDWSVGQGQSEGVTSVDVQIGSPSNAKLAEEEGFTMLDSPCSTTLPSLGSPGGTPDPPGTPLLTPMGPKVDLNQLSKLDLCEQKSLGAPPGELTILWEAMAH